MNKLEQQNTYQMYDSNGRSTGLMVTASNKSEAMVRMNEKGYARLHPWGKVKREYSGGVRG